MNDQIQMNQLIADARALLDRIEKASAYDLSVDEYDYVLYHIENALNSLENAIQY